MRVNNKRLDNTMDMMKMNSEALNPTLTLLYKLNAQMRVSEKKTEKIWFGVTRLAASNTNALKDSLLALQKLDNILQIRTG